MKNKFQKFLLIPGLFLLTISCQKNISLEPIFFQPTTYASEAQLTAQLLSIYNPLEQDQLYGQGLWVIWKLALTKVLGVVPPPPPY